MGRVIPFQLDFSFRSKDLRFPLRFCQSSAAESAIKKNRISLEIVPCVRFAGHLPRRQSSETQENGQRLAAKADHSGVNRFGQSCLPQNVITLPVRPPLAAECGRTGASEAGPCVEASQSSAGQSVRGQVEDPRKQMAEANAPELPFQGRRWHGRDRPAQNK